MTDSLVVATHRADSLFVRVQEWTHKKNNGVWSCVRVWVEEKSL